MKEKYKDLTFIKMLGKGQFGKVYLTKKDGINEEFATKVLSKKEIAKHKQEQKQLHNEIKILESISHPNIIKLVEKKADEEYIYLVFEKCNGGELEKCLKDYQLKFKKPFSQEIVQHIMKQLVSAIDYLHNQHIMHRDLKLANILLNFDSEIDKEKFNILKAQVKLIDFGFARYLDQEELAESAMGSPILMDPGILKKHIEMKNKRANIIDSIT